MKERLSDCNSRSEHAIHPGNPVFLLAVTAISIQFYSLLRIKPFWLDEWFVIYSIKFLSYSDLFGILPFTQQFPRCYLVLIKVISSISGYSYFGLRLLPFFIQILNVFLFFRISSLLFAGQRKKQLAFILIILSFFTTVHYFFQIKHYSAEMLASLLAFFQYRFFCRIPDKSGINRHYLLWSLLFLILPLVSYTYAFTALPVFIFFFYPERRKISGILILPACLFTAGLLISWFTDLRMVLNDKTMNIYWENFLIKTQSLKIFIKTALHSLINFFGLAAGQNSENKNIFILFGMHTAKLFFSITAVIGFSRPICAFFSKKSAVNRFNHDQIYFSGVIILILAAGLAGKLPLGPMRLNYFALPALAYFMISSGRTMRVFTRKKIAENFIIIIIIVISSLFFIQRYVKEAFDKNQFFSRKSWENAGNALKNAYRLNLPVFINSPAAEYDRLCLLAHPEFNIKNPRPIFITSKLSSPDLPGVYISNWQINIKTSEIQK